MIWELEGLIRFSKETTTEINGKWVPARPLDLRGFKERLRDAKAVFNGTASAFKWPEGQ